MKLYWIIKIKNSGLKFRTNYNQAKNTYSNNLIEYREVYPKIVLKNRIIRNIVNFFLKNIIPNFLIDLNIK